MVRTIIYDKVTALTAAQGITAALLARERGAGGQHVKTLNVRCLYFNWPDLMWNLASKGRVCSTHQTWRTCARSTKPGWCDHFSYLGADCSGYETEQLLQLLAENDIPVG